MDSIKMIKDLTNAFGAPGFERDVVDVAKKYISDDFMTSQDNLHNLYIRPKKENKHKFTVMLDAHSDEVGLMVRYINSNGTIVFTTLGGWVPAVLPSSKLRIKARDGSVVIGVVASKPPHFGSWAKIEELPPAIDQMVIDVGCISKEEVEDLGIGVGSPIVPCVDFEQIGDNMIAKAFDCRLGCAALIDTLEAVKNVDLGVNVVGALSAQEENDIRGARVVANVVRPDLAIIFEGSPADDTFAVPDAVQTAFRKGPMLRHMDEGMITHPGFLRLALDCAKANGITVQEAVRLGGATNGSAYHLSNEGIPAIVIGYPVRFIHSHHGIASITDYKAGVALAMAILKELNDENITKLLGGNA